ncbi:G-protein coupled receptor moody-like [Diadema antillarum]|uniref:G-protein coupled receptor moody-like n=1 Tax=Diadema antillarum TaxID=105358 RepID=UPI003A8A134D
MGLDGMTSTNSLSSENASGTTTGNGTQTLPDVWLILAEGVSLAIIMATSLIANIIAIATILRLRVLRSIPHHLLVLNLSVADLGITLTSMPFALYSIFDGGELLLTNPMLCKMNGFFAVLFTFTNFPTVLCIAFDRFLIVVYSGRFPPNRFRIVVMVTVSWCSALAFALLPSAGVLSEFAYSPDTWHCSPRWDHDIFRNACVVFIFGLAVPMVAVCYAAIVYFIWTKQKLLRSYSMRESAPPPPPLHRKGRRRPSRGLKTTSFTPGNASPLTTSSSRLDLPRLPEMQGSDLPNGYDSPAEQRRGCLPRGTSPSEKYRHSSNDSANGEYYGKRHPYEPDVQCEVDGSLSGSCSGIPRKVSATSWEDCDAATGEQDYKTREVRQFQLSADKRVALMGALLVLTTLVCWTPYLLVHSDYIRVKQGHWFAVFTMLLGYTNTFLDPLIYTFINKRARKECRRYWRSLSPFSRSSWIGEQAVHKK